MPPRRPAMLHPPSPNPIPPPIPNPTPPPPPNPTFHPTFHSSIAISTQNVGGMRGEFQLKRGPKISMIRKLVTPYTDFLILTEIRADQRAIMNTRIKYGICPSHFSASQHPRGGVLICANQKHKKWLGVRDNQRHQAT
jgi:hypothetical protein